MHYKGVGVAKNVSIGEMYYKKAADLDDAEAAFDLAALYQVLFIAVLQFLFFEIECSRMFQGSQ